VGRHVGHIDEQAGRTFRIMNAAHLEFAKDSLQAQHHRAPGSAVSMLR
jgi:hypothetical protein